MCNCDDGWVAHHRGHAGRDADGRGPLPPGGGVPGSGLPGRRARPDLRPGTSRRRPTPEAQASRRAVPEAADGAPTPTPAPFSTGIFGDKPTTVGPIVGVKIAMHKKALRKWRDREYYDEWRFIAGDADNDVMQDPAHRAARSFIPTPRK